MNAIEWAADICPIRIGNWGLFGHRSYCVGERASAGNSGPSVDSNEEKKDESKRLPTRKVAKSEHWNISLFGLQVALLVFVVALTFYSFFFLYRYSTLTEQAKSRKKCEKCWYDDDVVVVFCSGWITAVSTCLAPLPFIFIKKPTDSFVASCNSIAAGMMIAASIGLLLEGVWHDSDSVSTLSSFLKVLLGLMAGAKFVRYSSTVLDSLELEGFDFKSASVKRMFLIMGVMTLHSVSEGIGIGVSFCSEKLGGFVSASLALHNIPEGITVVLILFPQGFGVISTTLWCLFSSFPQPIMAVVSYTFARHFSFIFPIGMGLAAGAMIAVVTDELLPEAIHFFGPRKGYGISAGCMLAMGLVQLYFRNETQL